MTKEALEICKKCREKQKKECPQSINCAFLHDDMYCDRLEDINALIEKLLERSKEEQKAEEIAKDIYIHHFDDDVNYLDVLKAITVGVQKGYHECQKELEAHHKTVCEQLTNTHRDIRTQAKEIILMLYNAGRDVLMCRNEEQAYINLDKAINDKSIEQFLRGGEK